MRKLATLAVLLVAWPTDAAPRLKPRPYAPADWIDKLANDPPAARPWAAMLERVRDMDPVTAAAVGRRLSAYLHARNGRVGTPDRWVFLFDFDCDWAAAAGPEDVAGLLFAWKWMELHGGDPGCLDPPAEFWDHPEPNQGKE